MNWVPTFLNQRLWANWCVLQAGAVLLNDDVARARRLVASVFFVPGEWQSGRGRLLAACAFMARTTIRVTTEDEVISLSAFAVAHGG